MKLMLHHATGLPGAISKHSNRKSKSFNFFVVLLHGQEILTMPIMYFSLFKGLLNESVQAMGEGGLS